MDKDKVTVPGLPEEQVKKHYTMEYNCPNCRQSFRQTFDFGDVASQGVCPNCGVHPKYAKFKEIY